MKKIIVCFLFIFGFIVEVYSQWSSDSLTNLAICNANGDQATPKIASTSDGGCYIAWFDNRVPNYHVYLQRLDKWGVPQFAPNGLLISSNPQNTFLQDFNIDVDASDNAVIVFTDRRNGTQLNPFAYLISSLGDFLWGANGVSLTDSISISQNIPVVTATSDGNYVFAWSYSSSPNRLAIQKLNSAGVPQWGSAPIKLSGTGAENFNFMRLIKSDAGSVIMSWDAYTGNIATTTTVKIFIQKFSSSGSTLWTTPQDTVQNLGRVSGIGFIPSLVSDNQNGAVVSWVDDRDANARQSVWVQRFNSSGAIQFPKNGSEGSTLSTNNHFSPSSTYLSQTGETVMFWHETNGGQTIQGGLYGQKFDASGTRQWTDNGKEFKALDNNQLSFISTYSKDTNVIVTYSEAQFASANVFIKGLKTGPSSNFHWQGNIITASSFLSSKIRKQAILDKNSGMSVMTWSDTRSGSGDIYAQNINFDGSLGFTNPNAVPLNITVGIEGMWNGTTQVQDTMRFYLRNNFAPFAVVDSAIVFLSSTGNAVAIFPNAPSGNYYIQTKHRNALEIWSANPVSFSTGNITTYDFTTLQTQTFGNNSVLKLGRYSAYSGDVQQDGIVDAADLSLVDNDVFNSASGYVNTDVNGDNFVDASDLSIVDNNVFLGVILMRP